MFVVIVVVRECICPCGLSAWLSRVIVDVPINPASWTLTQYSILELFAHEKLKCKVGFMLQHACQCYMWTLRATANARSPASWL